MNPDVPSLTPTQDSSLLLAAMLGGSASLSDGQILAALLDSPDLMRANALLQEGGNLYHLVHGAPMELQSWGLSEAEIVRIMVQSEITSRVIAQRRKGHLGSLSETVQEIRVRGEQWSGECVGLLAMDSNHRVLVDRLIYQGTPNRCPSEINEILRIAVRASAHEIVVYRWSPLPDAVLLPEDRVFTDRLRLAASALELQVVDVLLISEGSYVSLCYVDDWAPR